MSTDRTRPRKPSASLIPVELAAGDWEEILRHTKSHLVRMLGHYLKDLDRRIKRPSRRLPAGLHSFMNDILAIRAFKVALHKAGVTAELDTRHEDELLSMILSHHEGTRTSRVRKGGS